MATYKEIKGVTVQTLDSDPTVNVGSWASGGNLNEGRSNAGGAGTRDAALMFGGYDGSSATATNESYNGTAFTEGSDLNTARYNGAGLGTSTAALLAGGYITTNQNVVESCSGS